MVCLANVCSRPLPVFLLGYHLFPIGLWAFRTMVLCRVDMDPDGARRHRPQRLPKALTPLPWHTPCQGSTWLPLPASFIHSPQRPCPPPALCSWAWSGPSSADQAAGLPVQLRQELPPQASRPAVPGQSRLAPCSASKPLKPPEPLAHPLPVTSRTCACAL